MPQGLIKGATTKIKGLNKIKKESGPNSEKEYQIQEKPPKVARESSKSNQKS